MHFVAELNCQEIRAGLRKMFPVVVVVKLLWRSAATYEVASSMPSRGGHISK